MKIYLVLKYQRQGENVWADVEAFTSPRQRDAVLSEFAPDADVEGVDVTVTKRAYHKAADPLPDVEAVNG